MINNLFLKLLGIEKQPGKTKIPQIPTQNPKDQKDTLIQALNIVRRQNNLPPLTESSKLDKSALEKAQDLVNLNYWAHQRLGGQEPWELMKNAGYDYLVAGENLARGYTSDQQNMDSWMASPSHKDVILDPRFTELGIGRAKDKEGHEYVATHFGKPRIVEAKTTIPSPAPVSPINIPPISFSDLFKALTKRRN